MNELQKHQLDMAIEIDKICKKYDIKYSLSGGTLLGAIRHEGFIPWDDDLDLLMSRKDYNKFLSVAQKELKNNFFLQTLHTDKHYGLPFAKIRENNTLMIEEMSKNVDINQGIYIDIFPYDNISDNKIMQKYLTTKYIFFRMLLLLKENYNIETNSRLKKVILSFLNIIKFLFTKKKIIKIFEKIEKKYQNINTKNVAVYGDVSFDKLIFSKDYFNEVEDMNFENKKLSCIKKYDEFLTKTFGDYMTPPPEDQKYNRHDILKIDFNCKK